MRFIYVEAAPFLESTQSSWGLYAVDDNKQIYEVHFLCPPYFRPSTSFPNEEALLRSITAGRENSFVSVDEATSTLELIEMLKKKGKHSLVFGIASRLL